MFSSMQSIAAVAVLAVVACTVPVQGNFLRRSGELPDMSHEVGPDIGAALATEIEEALSLGGERWRAAQGRAVHIKEALRPTFAAMPKNAFGKLDHAGVRYALHRLFVARHAWFIQGLLPDGEGWGSENAGRLLHDQVPERVQSLFEARVGQQGLGLEELTILAATLEHLVHNEVSGHLSSTFRLLDVQSVESLDQARAQELLDAYMSVYILGGNISSMSQAQMRNALRSIAKVYPTWPHTQEWVRTVYNETVGIDASKALSFDDVVSVAEEVGERYGRWQNSECLDLKEKMGAFGDQTTGRVRLADFYSSAVNDGQWQFSESVAYLRELGALDESDASNPRVIIPNYINSPSNCVASSNYYSVCCINECEELLGHLEERVGAPTASDGVLAALVAALPSATRAAGRSLSAPLLAKLGDVADHHGGDIPLHGRLFAQWMHLAYPMECPFPHASGATSPSRALDWMEKTGASPTLNATEMMDHINAAPAKPTGESEEGVCGMWSMEEELVTGSAPPRNRGGRGAGASILRAFFLLAAAASATLAALRTARSACTACSDGLEKSFV